MAAAFWVFTALTAFSVVYFGEHYVLDCVAGVAWAWLAVRVAARWAPAAAAAIPPAEAERPPDAKRAA
jgi:membrane-associated phospholipid phosphatase